MKTLLKIFYLAAAIFFFCGTESYAASEKEVLVQEPAALDFKEVNKELERISKRLNSGQVLRKESEDFIEKLSQLQTLLLNAQKQDAATMQNIAQKQKTLSTLTDENEKDIPEVAKERKQLEDSASKQKALLAQETLILTKIDELNTQILQMRNKELLSSVLAKQSSIFEPSQFWQSLLSFGVFLKEVLTSPYHWYQDLKPEQQQNALKSLGILTLMLGFALILAVGIRSFIKKHHGYNLDISTPSYPDKLKAAGWIFLALGIIPSAIIAAIVMWINGFELMKNSAFAITLKNAAVYLLYFLIIRAGILAAFTPNNPDWRLFAIEARKVRRTSNALITAALVITVVSFFQNLAAELSHQPEIVYSMQIFANAIKAFAVIRTALKVMYDAKELTDEDMQNGNIQKLSFGARAALLITIFILAAFSFSLFGYINLSEYLINRFIVSVVVISGLYILNNFLRIIYRLIIRQKFWTSKLRINPRSLIKSEVWFGIILTPALYLFGIMALLAVWGVSVDILIGKTKGFLTGFYIGEVHISITSIVLGLISFWVMMLLVKMLKNSLQNGNLSRLDFDDGMKNSIISGVGFFGFIFSVVLGIAVAGGSFKSLALMAGALSFGAGLGLQNIVSNLVAGITILFERPIKLGDWVIINGYEGIVKQISMRSTTIESGDKSNVIIPNSAIISGNVVNKTYDSRMSKISISVGVDYESDIDKVKEILLKIAADDPDVLSTPAPSVSFADFGDNSLNFQLNCYTANIFINGAISFRLRTAIITEFRKENINIPFPQRVVRPLENGTANAAD